MRVQRRQVNRTALLITLLIIPMALSCGIIGDDPSTPTPESASSSSGLQEGCGGVDGEVDEWIRSEKRRLEEDVVVFRITMLEVSERLEQIERDAEVMSRELLGECRAEARDPLRTDRGSRVTESGRVNPLPTPTSTSTTQTIAVVPGHSPATGKPTITGTAQVGVTLTADTLDVEDDDGLANVSYGYQWIANDGNSDTDVTGATDSTYTLADTDEGKTIKVRVSFTDDIGNEESLTSAATATVKAAALTEPPDTPRNLAAVVNSDGSVTLTWDDPDDGGVTGYQILRRNPDTDPQGEFTTISEDTGSSTGTYTDDTATPDTPYIYRIKAINSHGMSQRSKYVRADVPAQHPPATPTGLTATADRDAVTLSWDDPGDASITGYQVLRRNRDVDQAGDFTVIKSDTGSQSTGYIDSAVEPDTRYVYRIKAINVHGLSEWSGFTRANTPQ